MGAQNQTLLFRRLNRWRLQKSPWKVGFLLLLWLIALMSEVRAQGDLKKGATGTITNNGTIRVKGQAIGLPVNINGVFEYFGANQSIPAVNYNNLKMTGSGINTTSGGNFSVNGDLTIAASAQMSVPAPNVISLNGTIIEQGYLSGSIQKTIDLTFVPSADFGGMGSTLSWTGTSPGLTTVKRTSGAALFGEAPTFIANQSIKRYYDIALSNTGFNGTFDFKYHDLELNGQDETTLGLWRSTDNGVTWRRQGGTVNPATNTITKTGILSFSKWTASDADHPLGPAGLEWVAQNLAATSGSGQSAPVNTNLGSPYVVTVTDGYGNPIAGTTVTFSITGTPSGASGQNLSATTVTTNASGQASTTLHLGSAAGTYSVAASSGSLAGSPLTFTASATGGAPPPVTPIPTAMALFAGTGQVDTVGKKLPNLLTVTVVDQFGLPYAGVTVSFAVTGIPSGATGQQLSPVGSVTGGSGRVTTEFTLGSRPGTYTVVATSPALTGASITFTNTAVVGRAAILAASSGSGQTQVAKTTLAQPFVVLTTDRLGNPAQGVSVRFAVTTTPTSAAGYSITDTLVVTNAQGLAQSTLMLGDSSGLYKVTATSIAVPDSQVVFSATATPAPTVLRAASLAMTSGNNQTGVVGVQAASPLTVTVFDQFGTPFSGKTVTFEIASTPASDGFASLTNTTVITDSSGRASTFFVVGHKAGTYSVAAKSDSLSGSPATFTVNAVAGPVASISTLSGLGQAGEVNTVVAQPFELRVADAFGNPVQGVNVLFAITATPIGASGQAMASVNGTTDASGRASARLLLGDKTGLYQISVSVAGAPGVTTTFDVSAVPSGSGSISKFAGMNQTALVGTTLSQAFVIRVVDGAGTPVSGRTVTFVIDSVPLAATGQSLSVSTAVTGADGLASTVLTLGDKPGVYRFMASSAGLLGSPVFFRATATSSTGPTPVPALMTISAGNNQADTVGRRLSNSMIVTVLDQFGAPFAGASVNFNVSSAPASDLFASLTSTSVTTNASGQASVGLTLGHKPGTYVVTATSASLSGSSIVFSANAVAGRAMYMTQTSGNYQTGLVKTPLANLFVASVVDTFGNAKQGVNVQFALSSVPAGATGHALTSLQSITDAQGRASVKLVLGDKVGTYQVSVTAPGLIGSPTLFAATAALSDGSDQTGFLTARLLRPFSVVILDASGNPVRGASVTFSIDSVPGGATGQNLNGATTITVTTDSNGVATTSFTLGNQPGLYKVSARLTGAPGDALIFFAMAIQPASRPTIAYTAGNAQSARILSQLTSPLVVTALNADGTPLPGETIFFSVDSMPAGAVGQLVTPAAVTTDASGRASVVVKLGSKVGTYRIRASSENLIGSPIEFRVRSTVGLANSIVYMSGDNQLKLVGSMLDEPFVAQVVDVGGNPVPGIEMQFAIDSLPIGARGHQLSALSATTDDSGLAATVLTLGDLPGVYKVSASMPGFKPILFKATAVTSTGAVRIAYTSGNGQTAPVGAQLASPLVVTVFNISGGPIAGQQVTFAVDSTPAGANGQSVSPTVVATDASGRATASITLGSKTGVYKITATSDGLVGNPVEFRVRATTGAARSLITVAGIGQSKIVGASLDSAFVARVVDEFGNPVAGVPVTFSIDSIPTGSTGVKLLVKNSMTDELGQAAAVLTLGTKAGVYVVSAQSGSLTGSPVKFTARATSSAPAAVVMLSGNDQTAPLLSTLPVPFVVTVIDLAGNLVEGVGVVFAIDSIPNGAVGQSLRILNATTDADGRASASLTLGSRDGRYTVTATSANLLISRVRFVATASVQRGDVNNDRGVDIADLTTIIDHILGRTRLVGNDSVRADINRDSRITVTDVVALQNNILAVAGPSTSVQNDSVLFAQTENVIDREWSSDTAKVKSEFILTDGGIRFSIANSIPLKGIQLTMRFKNDVTMRNPDVYSSRVGADSFYVRSSGREMRLVAYNLSNTPIAVGDGWIFRLPIILSSIDEIESSQLVASIADPTTVFDKALPNVPSVRYVTPTEIPLNFVLYQNYPNPFNGTTKIEYEVPDVDGRGARVLLQVFDVLGSKIKTLVARFHAGGRYSVIWDGKDEYGRTVSSGTYYYRLVSGDYVSGKKMILLK